MNFNLIIENLGNIDKGIFEIKPLTIIAGENGSGKSFATKSIYSILDALNKDYITKEFISNLSLIKQEFNIFEERFTSKAIIDEQFIEKFNNEYDPLLFSMLESYRTSDLELQEILSKDFEQKCKEIIEDIESYYNLRITIKKFLNFKDIRKNIKLFQKNIRDSKRL